MKNKYLSTEVLNTKALLHNNYQYNNYYIFFENINKPNIIYSLIGMIIELTYPSTIKDINNIISYTKLSHIHKINNYTYFIVLFNNEFESIKNELLNITNIFIGIYICHPLIYIDDFILNTLNQLYVCKHSNCKLSLFNEYD